MGTATNIMEDAFNPEPITVGGKYLTSQQVKEVVFLFFKQRQDYLRAGLRAKMAQMAALGHRFTESEWMECLSKDEKAEIVSISETPVDAKEGS